MSEELKNTKQAADHIRLNRHTLENWRCQGRGPAFVRVGSRIFYRVKDLDDFLERNRCEPAASCQSA